MCCHICSCSTVSKGPEDRPMKCPKCRHRVSEVFLKHFLTEVPVVLVRRNVGSASSACVCPAPSAPQVPPASQPAPAPPLLSALFFDPAPSTPLLPRLPALAGARGPGAGARAAGRPAPRQRDVMGTRVVYTPLYGAKSDGPVCGVLQVRAHGSAGRGFHPRLRAFVVKG